MPSEFVKEVADVFAKDGPLSKVTANYTPRPSQIEFATSVAEALEQDKQTSCRCLYPPQLQAFFLFPMLPPPRSQIQFAKVSACYSR